MKRIGMSHAKAVAAGKKAAATRRRNAGKRKPSRSKPGRTPRRTARNLKKFSKKWGPGNPLWEWRQNNPNAKPKRSRGKKKGKMPENVKRYFKLLNQGVSKGKAKKMCGM